MVAMLLAAELARSTPDHGVVAKSGMGDSAEGSESLVKTSQLRRFIVKSGTGTKEQVIATRART
eukprot:1064958-Rhodomonas_salina.1